MTISRGLHAVAASAVFILVVAGCAGGVPGAASTSSTAPASSAPAQSESAPVPDPDPTTADPTTAPPATRSPGPLDELTPDDDLAMNPPAPTNVRAGAVTAGAVELMWDEPPPVSVPHTYSDRVVEYRIYRSGVDDPEPTLIGSSTDLGFTDDTAQSGQRYRYTVTSVRERHVEGSMSDPAVAVTVP